MRVIEHNSKKIYFKSNNEGNSPLVSTALLCKSAFTNHTHYKKKFKIDWMPFDEALKQIISLRDAKELDEYEKGFVSLDLNKQVDDLFACERKIKSLQEQLSSVQYQFEQKKEVVSEYEQQLKECREMLLVKQEDIETLKGKLIYVKQEAEDDLRLQDEREAELEESFQKQVSELEAEQVQAIEIYQSQIEELKNAKSKEGLLRRGFFHQDYPLYVQLLLALLFTALTSYTVHSFLKLDNEYLSWTVAIGIGLVFESAVVYFSLNGKRNTVAGYVLVQMVLLSYYFGILNFESWPVSEYVIRISLAVSLPLLQHRFSTMLLSQDK